MSDDNERQASETIATILEQAAADELQDYLSRGRRFQNIETDALKAYWTKAAQTWLRSLGRENPREMDDAAAELGLRGISLPYEAVTAELDALRAEIERDKDDPEVLNSVEDRIRELLSRRDDFH